MSFTIDEKAPLLSAKDTDLESGVFEKPQPVTPPATVNQWDGEVLQCCGDCGQVGWSACLGVHCFPCLMFGWNVRRALNWNFWLHTVAFMGSFYLARLVYVASVVQTDAVCQPLHSHNDMPARVYPLPLRSCQTLQNYWSVSTQAEADLLFTDGNQTVSHPVNVNELTMECHNAVSFSAFAHLLMVVMFYVAVFYAAKCRGLIRERFNIPGNNLLDFAAWFCCPLCSLCQETRTLMKHRVEEGVWRGPLPATLPISQAPPAQTMPKA